MTMQHTAGRNRRTTLLVAAGVSAMALLLWMAVGQTTAAFTAQTNNPGNAFKTGTVQISTDQPVGTALFTMGGMLPGHFQTERITVQNDSTAPLGVRLYAANFLVTADTSGGPRTSELAEHLEVTVDIVDGADVVQSNVFTGSMAEFAAAGDWTCGWWSEADPEECNPSPAMGPLERLLRNTLDEGQQEDVPAPVWAAVQTADDNIAGQPLAAAWAQVPDEVKDLIPPAQRTTIEAAIASSPSGETVGSVIAPTPSPGPEKTYPELGDRLEETSLPGSSAIYRITVKLADDAGSFDINPNDQVDLDFVWEGRA